MKSSVGEAPHRVALHSQCGPHAHEGCRSQVHHSPNHHKALRSSAAERSNRSKSYMGQSRGPITFLYLCNRSDKRVCASCYGYTRGQTMKSQSPESYLTFQCCIGHRWRRACVYIFHRLSNSVWFSHHFSGSLGVGRHPCQDCWGLGACLPVGAWATSPPQVPGSKPLRQDRTVSDLWPLPPPHLLLLWGMALSSHGRCLAAPFFFLLKVFALWPSDCVRNAPVTLQINKSSVSSHDPRGQKHIPVVGLDFPCGNLGHICIGEKMSRFSYTLTDIPNRQTS